VINLENTITGNAWKKVGIRHHHGINVPLASIRTENSSGIGEFLDLLPLIDYCSSLKLDVIQVLPLNDSGLDPSPYNAISSTALHPIYLSLHALPNLPKDLSHDLPCKKLNETKNILYLNVLSEKLKWLQRYLEVAAPAIIEDPGYQIFIQNNEPLLDYALYKVLKEKNRNQVWQEWEEEEKNPSKTKKHQFYKTYAKEIEFHCIVQYLCASQLKMVKAHAEERGVFMQGDIPILVSPDSVDVWAHREFFDLTQSAGSPPNPFDPKGQLWKFPLYNWKAMEENHFEWWRERIQLAAEYFHIYRIDHILGFFRIWAIPNGERADKGYFIPSELGLMEAQGRKLLKTLVLFSDMLPIGEDLGDPPPFVRECMKEYGIPGTKIFRRYRNWKTDKSFIPYAEYTPISLSAVSTHDIETVWLWWKNFPDEAAAYATFKQWDYSPELTPEQQFEILYDNHHCGSLFHVNLLQEYLALVPELTWEDPNDERINFPGTESTRNWSYRYKEPLEILLKNENLKTLFKKLLSE